MPRLPASAVSRRRALGQIASLAAWSALPPPLWAREPAAGSPPAADTLRTGPIDAHVHVWTDDLNAAPLAAGFRPHEMQPGSFTPSELFTHTVPAGVGRIVLIQMSYYGFDNRYLLAALARYPGVFSAVAVVDEQAPGLEATLRELVRQGVRGVRVQPSRGKETDPARFFASPGMTALWRCAAAERLAVCLLVNPGELPAVADVCAKFPDTPVVIDHFGRVGIDGTMREADLQNLCALGRHAQVRVKVSAFYALGRKQPPYTDLVPMIRRVLDAFGPQRLMWASDAPFQVLPPHTYQASLDLVRQRLDFLSPGDRHWLLRKTAEQTYFG